MLLAEKLLAENIVDIFRLRHRWGPGENFDILDKYKKFYNDSSLFGKMKRILRPKKASRIVGAAIYAHNRPEVVHPNIFTRYNQHTYIISSKYLNWTNQSVMFNKQLLLETLLPYVNAHPSSRNVNGLQDIEKSLNCNWWRKQNYQIGVGLGLFTHQRLDR